MKFYKILDLQAIQEPEVNGDERHIVYLAHDYLVQLDDELELVLDGLELIDWQANRDELLTYSMPQDVEDYLRAYKTPEECLENCKIQRDTKLSLNKVEIRPNEFVNARLEDKVNLESIYKSLQEGDIYEFYNGGYFIWLSKEEIYEVLLRGQQQMEDIWDEFKAQVKAI